jgi:hypothetical protein
MSTLDNTRMIIKELKIGMRGRKREKYLLFVDFKKAFDLVDRNLLLRIIN